MKGVILAAGVASRLRPLTDLVPKCLLEVGGGTILGLTLENLIANGIADIVIVTGYRELQIREYVGDSFPALDVEFVTNDRYAATNNIASLSLTEKSAGDGGVLLLDSDIVFDRRIIGLLTGSGHENCLAMKSGTALGSEEIKVETGPGNTVRRIGKDVPARAAAGESIGIEKLSAAFLGELYPIVKRMIAKEQGGNLFYEAAFEQAIAGGSVMTAVDVGGLQCIEIDTPEDLKAARALCAPDQGASRR
jgi:choline kinase